MSHKPPVTHFYSLYSPSLLQWNLKARVERGQEYIISPVQFTSELV